MSVAGAARVEHGKLTGSRPPQQGYGQPQYNGGYQSTPPPQQYGYQQVSLQRRIMVGGKLKLTWNSHLSSKDTANMASKCHSRGLPHISSVPA